MDSKVDGTLFLTNPANCAMNDEGITQRARLRGERCVFCNPHKRWEWSDQFVELTDLPSRKEWKAELVKLGKKVYGEQGPVSTHSDHFLAYAYFN